MREDRLDEYINQLTDKTNNHTFEMRIRMTRDIVNSVGGRQTGNVQMTTFVDDITFSASEDGTQIIVSVKYDLEIAYPPIVSTDAVFTIPVTETATINTVFM